MISNNTGWGLAQDSGFRLIVVSGSMYIPWNLARTLDPHFFGFLYIPVTGT